MSSRGKKKTTFAKIAREQKQRERRIDKQARKEARRRNAELDPSAVTPDEPAGLDPDAALDDRRAA